MAHFYLFPIWVAGTNPEESKSQKERMEAIKSINLGFPDEAAQEPDYFQWPRTDQCGIFGS
jgi:hypothetical protein